MTAHDAYHALRGPLVLEAIVVHLQHGQCVLAAVHEEDLAVRLHLDQAGRDWAPTSDVPYGVFFDPATDQPTRHDIEAKLRWWLAGQDPGATETPTTTDAIDPEIYRDEQFLIQLDSAGTPQVYLLHEMPNGAQTRPVPLLPLTGHELGLAQTLIVRLAGALVGLRRRLAVYEEEA